MRIAYFRRIVKIGNSKCVVVPREVRTLIGADVGDYVRIEIEKVEVNDTNLHAHYAARQDPEARDKGIHQESGHPQVDSCEGDRVKGIRTLAGEDIHIELL